MKEKIKILLLEDSEDDAGLISLTLKRNDISFDLKRVESRVDFEEAMDIFIPDIILSDHSLPQFNSIDAFEMYLEKKLQVPFILVTGTVSEEFAVNVIKQGVDDYILKSNLSRLPSAIFNAIRKRKAEQEKVKAELALILQNKELLKINQELDNFVYSVSHNLRSPLTSVLGLINLFKIEGTHEPTVSNYLRMIELCIKKLDNTLKDILVYSHNSHDKVEYFKIDFNKLVDDCYEGFMHITDINIIKREIIIQEKVPFYSDPYRLSILFRNILSNSIQFRDRGKEETIIRIIISAEADYASICIEDNGLGIDPQSLPDIFNMFYRGTEKSEGDGLGLYIAKEIIGKVKGTIELGSELGKGTKVDIIIPNHRKAFLSTY